MLTPIWSIAFVTEWTSICLWNFWLLLSVIIFSKLSTTSDYFNSFGPFWGFSRMEDGGGEQKDHPSLICHRYLTVMILGTVIHDLKKIQKTYKSYDTSLELCWHQLFLLEISNFCYIKKYGYSLHFNTYCLILLTFFESFLRFF